MSADEVTDEDVDFAMAAYREEGRWIVATLPARTATTAEHLVAALRQLPGEGGVFGFACIAEEFFVALRTVPGGVRGLVSDSVCMLDWSLAAEVADLIDLEWDEDEVEEFDPAGDLHLCSDFGLDADEMLMICQDDELLPDEQVRAIAKRMGFGSELSAVLRSR